MPPLVYSSDIFCTHPSFLQPRWKKGLDHRFGRPWALTLTMDKTTGQLPQLNQVRRLARIVIFKRIFSMYPTCA
ncbi:hypothetical protein CORC01_06449 [Colletotrichum orchidophilum]|uniref:Uncharacterized protein n=1 Tax=Colletotrichum orchidophilum TaxID=1209926 RepID=A0A1G4BAD4_9PEZI|nr:uncharacterized protein CORC01_06449 [Colletotrichum orchidophilum]OHE98252.1 hypothetical protein CORC01_06449 [Colletotrichum orchidophilum]